MKLMTGILAVAMMTGAAWGQNPDAIDNARSVAKSLQQIKTNQTNEALAAGSPAPQADKPVAGSPAKPATGQPAAAKAAGEASRGSGGEKQSCSGDQGREATRCVRAQTKGGSGGKGCGSKIGSQASGYEQNCRQRKAGRPQQE